MSILKHNGYRTKFYYGSDLDFDNQRAFLQRQGVDVMIGIDDYEKQLREKPGHGLGLRRQGAHNEIPGNGPSGLAAALSLVPY